MWIYSLSRSIRLKREIECRLEHVAYLRRELSVSFNVPYYLDDSNNYQCPEPKALEFEKYLLECSMPI